MTDRVLTFLEAERPAIVSRLLDWVRIPSVSTDPTSAGAMAESRNMLLGRLTAMGLSAVQTIEAGGHPAVYGEWLGAADRPTLLVYGHYDVQPPDPLDLWRSPPFEPVIHNHRIYGRGVSDDKGPTAIALETIAAFLSVEHNLPVNVKILIEGEEEIGSSTLGALLRAHRELLRSDALISADGARWRPDLVTVNVGSRGMAGFEFTVRSAAKDLHSGRFGGAVPNALHVLSDLVARLHDHSGRVAVPDFFDGVYDVPDEVHESLAEIPFQEESFFEATGSRALGEPEFTTLERLWFRPCLDVNGMWGGYTGPGDKTVIPSEAHAKLTMRLVPGQDPERTSQAVKQFLSRQCPEGCTVTFGHNTATSAAYELPLDHPLLQAVESTLQVVHGSRPYRIRIGGTLPVSDLVLRKLGIHTVMLSYSTADEDFHAPNEFFRLSSIDEGLRAWTVLFRHLGEMGEKDFAAFRS